MQEVPRELVRAGAPSQTGQLFAMMLDQKAAFDEVVQRHAKDPAAVKRILANPVYAQISGTLAGAQEYAAMAKLHDFDRAGAWDTIIVDTPPTSHALDFLDAPRKLSEAIDSPAIDWFRKLQGQGGSRWSIVGKTGTFILKRLAKFVGSKFIDDLGIFFTEFNDILGGFRTRAEETFALLRQPRVGFVLVASPEPMAVNEALAFHKRLVDASMPFIGFVVNKVHPFRPFAGGASAVDAALAPFTQSLGLTGTTRSMAAQALVAAHAELEVLATADRNSIGRLAKAGGDGALLIPGAADARRRPRCRPAHQPRAVPARVAREHARGRGRARARDTCTYRGCSRSGARSDRPRTRVTCTCTYTIRHPCRGGWGSRWTRAAQVVELARSAVARAMMYGAA